MVIIFFLSLGLLLILIIGSIFRPLIWIGNIFKIKVFYALWFGPYLMSIPFFTGPEDLSVYPPREDSPYRLPWQEDITRFVVQGNRGLTTHRGLHKYAWDFIMPNGTQILVARAGIVVEVIQHHDGFGWQANYIHIEHMDGNFSVYAHIQKNGALVSLEDEVKQGQPIALSGMVGLTIMPHFHFYVLNKSKTESIPVSFQEVEGGVPLAGRFYTSRNKKR